MSSIQFGLNQIRRSIGALTAVASAGITTRQMHLAYIDEVNDPTYPCLTLTALARPGIQQGNSYVVTLYIGVYTKTMAESNAITGAIAAYFTDGFYTYADSDVTIYSCDLAPTSFNYTPSLIKELNAYENMVELTLVLA